MKKKITANVTLMGQIEKAELTANRSVKTALQKCYNVTGRVYVPTVVVDLEEDTQHVEVKLIKEKTFKPHNHGSMTAAVKASADYCYSRGSFDSRKTARNWMIEKLNNTC